MNFGFPERINQELVTKNSKHSPTYFTYNQEQLSYVTNFFTLYIDLTNKISCLKPIKMKINHFSHSPIGYKTRKIYIKGVIIHG
jgi:hypothetical protein